jgi:HEAT repeat protein
MQALQDTDAGVRLAAALALNDIGIEARDALPALRQMAAADPSDDVRAVASDAVNRIQSLIALDQVK